jgi:hypothetical protein
MTPLPLIEPECRFPVGSAMRGRMSQFGTYIFLFVWPTKGTVSKLCCECLMSFREMLVALVAILDNLAVSVIIIPIVYLISGVFRGIGILAFALFRVLIQKPEQGELNI